MEQKDYINSTSSLTTTNYTEASKVSRKVVSGEVIKGHRSVGQQLTDIFFETDLATLRSRIIRDMVIPSVKRILLDSFEILLFGDTRRGESKGRYRDYASYSDGGSKPNRSNTEDRNRTRPSYEYYLFREKDDAEDVLASLREQIRQFGKASIADFYDFAGVTSEFTENRYGWYNLDRATVRSGRDGYYIDFPKAILIS